MKNEIEKALKESKLRFWTTFGKKVGRNRNFKYLLFRNIEKINAWLREIGLELDVKPVSSDSNCGEENCTTTVAIRNVPSQAL
jgi:hypothetical protein